MKLSFSTAQLGHPISNVPFFSQSWIFHMKLSHFKLSRKKKVPKYLDEEGDFVFACLRTCESNLSETILGCIIQDDVLAGVAVLLAYRPYCFRWG